MVHVCVAQLPIGTTARDIIDSAWTTGVWVARAQLERARRI
jgi:hypothetical protein